MNRFNLAWFWLSGLAVGFLIGALSTAPAHAAPGTTTQSWAERGPAPLAPWDDPHHPNVSQGFCPGGGAQLLNGKGWCDGVDYPDGSFWHQVPLPYFGVFRVTTGCYFHGGLMLQPAPGGCGGEG